MCPFFTSYFMCAPNSIITKPRHRKITRNLLRSVYLKFLEGRGKDFIPIFFQSFSKISVCLYIRHSKSFCFKISLSRFLNSIKLISSSSDFFFTRIFEFVIFIHHTIRISISRGSSKRGNRPLSFEGIPVFINKILSIENQVGESINVSFCPIQLAVDPSQNGVIPSVGLSLIENSGEFRENR